VIWAGPAEGRLACGAEGPGRLAPTEEILKQVKAALKEGK
jgi:phosphopantothenoylcysteine synthetase/decarboxylase